MADLQDADYCLREFLVVSDTDTLKAEKALQEGLAAFDGFQWDTAIESFRKAMTADANCRSACAKLAQAFAVRGQVKNSLEALYHVMDLFEAEDDLPGVIETANRILELYPDNDQARLKLVIAYHMLGNISEALRESRELAILYQEQGRGEEALNLLQRAKTLDPNNVDIHVEYAEAHITHGHIKEGSAALIAVADLCLALEAKRLENPPLEPAVVDPEDACPDKFGAPHPDPKKNGCPSLVTISNGRIAILKPVFFATNKDVILPQSFPVLQAVADALVAATFVKKISIEGHTDNRGKADYNTELSDRRAKSVMRWLLQHSIPEERLTAKGFGPTKPITENATAKGRAANRRVEFVIIDPPQAQSASSGPVEAPAVVDRDPDKGAKGAKGGTPSKEKPRAKPQSAQ